MTNTFKLKDSSLMPTGKYAGIKMANVPASHLIWIYENNRATISVRTYVKENLELLTIEASYEDKRNSREQ